jgi:hypothetical protein
MIGTCSFVAPLRPLFALIRLKSEFTTEFEGVFGQAQTTVNNIKKMFFGCCFTTRQKKLSA